MRHFALLLVFAACSVPDQQFHATVDARSLDAAPSGFVVDKVLLMVTEGEMGTFTVHLASAPSAVVSASVSATSAAVKVAPDSIDFTPQNWDQPVQVTVSPLFDTNDVSEMSTVSIESPGLAAGTVSVKTLDPTIVGTPGWPPTPQPFTSTASIGAGSIVAYQVSIPVDASLDKFGVYIPAATGAYRMALYRDQSNAPGALVAQIPAKVNLVNGENVFDVMPDTAIATSTTQLFWITIRTSAGAAISYSTSAMGRTCVRAQDIPNIDDAWPTTFGVANCGDDYLMNLWIATYR